MLALTLTIVVMAQGGGAAAPVELSVRPAAKVRIPYTLEVKASTTLRSFVQQPSTILATDSSLSWS